MSVNADDYFGGAAAEHLDEVYHGNSKHLRTRVGFASPPQMALRDRWIHETHRAVVGRYRTYERRGRIDLSRHALSLRMPLGTAIAERRSQRTFANEPVSIAELATLLVQSYGACGASAGPGGRPVPSGGGLYPLDLYVLQVPGRSVCDGVYHYHPREHVLQCVRATCASGDLAEASMYPEIVCGASALLVIVADMQRSRFKYGERSYRLVQLEAGHVSQTLYLIASALRIGIVALDGFYDDRVHALLDIDGVAEIALTSLAVGRVAQPS